MSKKTKLKSSIAVLLLVGAILSCTKETLREEKAVVNKTSTSITISKSDYLLIKEKLENTKLIDSIKMVYSVLKPVKKLSSVAESTNDDNSQFDDGADETSFYEESYGGDLAGIFGDAWRYNIHADFWLPKRRNTFKVIIPILISGTVYNIDAQQQGNIQAYVTGNNIGNISQPILPFVNLNSFTSVASGNSSGDVVETRTLVTTSDGKVTVKAGLQAEGVVLGSEVSEGIKIVAARNQVCNYNWNLNFSLNFSQDMNFSNPRVSKTGTVYYSGVTSN